MNKWAVHNIHAPAVEIDENGYAYNGKEPIKLPEPLYVGETKDDAEEWRNTRLGDTAHQRVGTSTM